MNLDEFDVLYEIHHNRWPDSVLGEIFENLCNNILMKYERQIVELKVELYEAGMGEVSANQRICEILNIRSTTLHRYLRDIKYKFRNRMDLRVYKLLNPTYNYTRGRRKNKDGSFRKNIQG